MPHIDRLAQCRKAYLKRYQVYRQKRPGRSGDRHGTKRGPRSDSGPRMISVMAQRARRGPRGRSAWGHVLWSGDCGPDRTGRSRCCALLLRPGYQRQSKYGGMVRAMRLADVSETLLTLNRRARFSRPMLPAKPSAGKPRLYCTSQPLGPRPTGKQRNCLTTFQIRRCAPVKAVRIQPGGASAAIRCTARRPISRKLYGRGDLKQHAASLANIARRI